MTETASREGPAPAADPFIFQIIRQRLNQVIDEAIVALENVSGSPITNEGHDMMVSLYDSTGGLAVGGVGFLHHLTSAAQAVKHIVANFSDDPGIDEGDTYVLNDSYTAALHPPDIYVISPIHYRGRLTGFVSNFVHVTDIGATDPGGFSPNARDTYQEGFVTQGLKIVERGKTRKDVMETFLRNVRDPGMTALDLKSQLAANHVARERMRKLYDDHGVAAVEYVSKSLIAESEQRVRDRLRELPDGTWRARQYLDLPTGLHRVELAATKRGDTLTYDFTGTDPQVDVGVNCCYWSTWGGLFAPLYPLLCWDMTWNEGISRPIRMIAPEGTLVNCIRPAPISIATVGVIQTVNNLSATVLSKMLGASTVYADRATGVWHGSHLAVMLSGLASDGDYFVSLLTDTFAGSGGARARSDGIDLGGELPNVVSRWANVETQEHASPMRYLFRRPVPDSGGPGKWRGGVSHEFAFSAHDSAGENVTVGLSAKGIGVPMSVGVFGGYPACTIGLELFRGANIDELPESYDALRGAESQPVQWGEFNLGPRDVLYVRFMGGGGYGDPIDREAALVAADVGAELVSAQAAHDIYGVVLTDTGAVDEGATARRRLGIRAERVGSDVPAEFGARRQVSDSGRPLGAELQWLNGAVQCRWCGQGFATRDGHWKDQAVRREEDTSTAGRFRESVDGMVIRRFFCPRCATLLDTEVTLSTDPPLYDTISYS